MAWRTVGSFVGSWTEVVSDDPDADLPQAMALDGSWMWNVSEQTVLVRNDQLERLAGGLTVTPPVPRPMPTLTRPTSEPFEPRYLPGQPAGEPWLAVVASMANADPNADEGDLCYDKTTDAWYSYMGGGTWNPLVPAAAPPTSPLTLTAHTAGEIPLTLVGAAAQTAVLLTFKNNTGANVAWVSPDGSMTAPNVNAVNSVGASKLTTGTGDLVMEQTGDAFGTTRLHLQNRSGCNGALFENVGLDLVDFSFKTLSAYTGNLRLEGRGAAIADQTNPVPEFEFLFGGTYAGWVGASAAGVAGRFAVGGTRPMNASKWGNGGGPMLFLGNDTSDPTTNPTAGGIIYCSAGALKYRGSSGTVTQLAPA